MNAFIVHIRQSVCQSALVALLVLMIIAPSSFGQSWEDLKSTRVWTTSNGGKVKASVIKADLKGVLFKVGDKEFQTTYDKLDKSDALTLKVAYLDDSDFRQFERVKDKLGAVQTRPKTAADLFMQLHRDFPDSPYAGLWGAVALSEGNNEYEKAEKILRQTIDRINLQREVVNTRHAMTLCSAYNNLAIMHVKSKRGDYATTALVRSLGTATQIPFVVDHNAQQLTEFAELEGSAIKLSEANRKALTLALASKSSSAPASKMRLGWHYSLDFDIPSNSVASQKVVGIDPPIAGMELVGMGTGFVVAPGVVLTSRQLIEDMNNYNVRLLTSTAKEFDGTRKTYRVQTVHSKSTARIASEEVEVGGAFGGTFTFTRFEYFYPRVGSTNGEIAALKIPGFPVKPAKFGRQDPVSEADIAVLGYERGSDILANGVKSNPALLFALRTTIAETKR